MRTNKNKHQQRRLSSNNIISFGKSSCRQAVTARNPSSFSHIQGPFINCSTKTKDNVIKIKDYKKKKRKKLLKGSN